MKKLIEVAMPLDDINKAASREKSIRHGHPSTLHLWWARRPLATARAVLFASLVDDPGEHRDKFPTDDAVEAERKRLFKIIAEIVNWDNSGDEALFARALDEIKKSVGDDLPAVFDPFAGGGTIPLEAQRLGLKSCATDLNPVAVMINKAMIELPAKFKNRAPVHLTAEQKLFNSWRGAEGLADDILYYGQLLKSKAFDEIGDLYPKIDGKTVIAWLWARNVPCSNPACGHRMPLVHSFKLSTKQKVFVAPIVDGDKIRFEIRHYTDDKDVPAGTVNGQTARCLFCGTESKLAHVREQAKAGNMSAQLMAVVAEGERGRVYLPPDAEHERIADSVEIPDDVPEENLPDKALGFRVQEYGITQWHQLFTNRQLTALTTFGDLIPEIQEQVLKDGGDKDYADAIAVYLSFWIGRVANYNSSNCGWDSSWSKIRTVFGRQAISMTWDFAEANPFTHSSSAFDSIVTSVKKLPVTVGGEVERHSALDRFPFANVLVSTDPPYYDNIGYANLSEFFYVWLRRQLNVTYPKLFGRGSFDKDDELIAEPARHGGDKTAAATFFEDGMFRALQNIHAAATEKFPVTIYYAFKQREAKDGTSTGWETMLNAIIRAGFQITGTWPVSTEMASRMRSHESNALASSVVLVCRKRPPENDYMSTDEFLRTLKAELPKALGEMKKANIAPLDLAQAAIGPGMEVYSRCARVADMTDTPLTVRDALKIINAQVDEYLGEPMSDLDAASQFCVALFARHGYDEMEFGDADKLARAKNVSVDGLVKIGAVISERGIVRLRDFDEIDVIDKYRQLKPDWTKILVDGNCAWLWVQSLVKVFRIAGISGSGQLLASFDGNTEQLKNLAYRIYNLYGKLSPDESRSYNEMVTEWSDILVEREKFRAKKQADASKGQQALF